ncbi:MAG: SH3 domain-containing protein [Alkalinema sp. RU_4_3]|nr:SH3 domain-containing protein [Alkalinema sp. RU_4_3]
MATKPAQLIAIGLTSLAALTGGAIAFLEKKPTDQSSVVSKPPSLTPSPTAPEVSSPVPDKVSPKPDSPKKQPDRCDTSMAKVSDPNPPLNVRSAPDTSSNNITGKLQNGTYVTIEDETPDWYRIKSPTPGWIAKSKTVHACTEKRQQLTLLPSQTIRGEFIGSGHHDYPLTLKSGQVLTLTPTKGPRPGLIDPSGKVLEPMGEETSAIVFNPQIDGDYTVYLESRFKGYGYEFAIEVK